MLSPKDVNIGILATALLAGALITFITLIAMVVQHASSMKAIQHEMCYRLVPQIGKLDRATVIVDITHTYIVEPETVDVEEVDNETDVEDHQNNRLRARLHRHFRAQLVGNWVLEQTDYSVKEEEHEEVLPDSISAHVKARTGRKRTSRALYAFPISLHLLAKGSTFTDLPCSPSSTSVTEMGG